MDDHEQNVAESTDTESTTIREGIANIRDEAAELLEYYIARPLTRGWSHLIGSFAAFGAVAALVTQAAALLHVVASLIYGLGLVAALTTSALYHRVRWKPKTYHLVRRLDHSMIFVLIASSYTPVVLLLLEGSWRITALAVIWGAAAIAVTLRLTVRQLPRWVMVTICIIHGWAAISLIPALGAFSSLALTLVIASGVIYTLGGIVYLTRRPDPLPRIFGFHEVFHACVLAAASLHFIAIWPMVAG